MCSPPGSGSVGLCAVHEDQSVPRVDGRFFDATHVVFHRPETGWYGVSRLVTPRHARESTVVGARIGEGVRYGDPASVNLTVVSMMGHGGFVGLSGAVEHVGRRSDYAADEERAAVEAEPGRPT